MRGENEKRSYEVAANDAGMGGANDGAINDAGMSEWRRRGSVGNGESRLNLENCPDDF